MYLTENEVLVNSRKVSKWGGQKKYWNQLNEVLSLRKEMYNMTQK